VLKAFLVFKNKTPYKAVKQSSNIAHSIRGTNRKTSKILMNRLYEPE
jgi:hypothetical protein